MSVGWFPYFCILFVKQEYPLASGEGKTGWLISQIQTAIPPSQPLQTCPTTPLPATALQFWFVL